MSSSLFTTTKIALAFLSVAGFYTTWYFILSNGTADYMAHFWKRQLLPGTDEPLRTVYTGLAVIDRQLAAMTLLIWDLVNGSNPSASLLGFYFATQVFCGWGLLVVESYRHANRWTLISFVGVWGILMQTAAYAVIAPIWCIAHLSLSTTVSSRRLSDHLISVPDLAGIGFAMVNFYLALTIIMCFPAPSILSHDLKQWLMATWHLFPIWVSLVQAGVSYLLSRRLGKESSIASSSTVKMNWLRALYSGLMMGAALGQAKTLTLLWSSAFLPGLFADEFIGVFNFPNVFMPAATSPYTKAPSLGSGVFLMLQYDYFVGSIAIALWSTVLFAHTYRNGSMGLSPALMIFGVVVMLMITGPLGYATAFAWARDELLFAEAEAGVEAKDDGKMKKVL